MTMRDEFVGFRLPDLPTAGYSTRRQKELTDAVMFFIRSTERNRPYLLEIVLDGRDKFRRVGQSAWRHLKVDHDLCDAVYGYLVLLAGENPRAQYETLQAMGLTSRG